MEWMRNKSTGDVNGSSHELPCLSKEEDLNKYMSIGHFWGVTYKIREELDREVVRHGVLQGTEPGSSSRQVAVGPVWRKSRRLCKANLCQSVHQADNLVSEVPPIAGNRRNTFKPWGSVRLRASMASYRHYWKVRNDTFPQEERMWKEVQRENWNMFFHVFRRLMTWEIHLASYSLPACSWSRFSI